MRVRGEARFRARYNLGPQSSIPVVRSCSVAGGDATRGEAHVREVCAMKWGLVPAFAKRAEDFDTFRGGASTFNARIEGVETSGLWKRLLDRRRAVVLLDGFYEWKALPKGKQPMFIRNRDEYAGHAIPDPPSALPVLPSSTKVLPPAAAEQPRADAAEAAASGLVGDDVVGRLREIFPGVNDNTIRLAVAKMGSEEAAAGFLVDTPPDQVSASLAASACRAAEAVQVIDEDTGPSHAPLMLAALYDVWRPGGKSQEGASDAEAVESVTILTMDPLGTPMEKIHNRMPVFLTPETAARWLDPCESFAKIVNDTLRASGEHAKKDLHMYEVSTLVSSMKNDSPDCVLPKKEIDSRQLANGIGRFFQKAAKQDATQAAAAEKRKADKADEVRPAKAAKLS